MGKKVKFTEEEIAVLSQNPSTKERSSDGNVMAAILAVLKCLKRWPIYSMYL